MIPEHMQALVKSKISRDAMSNPPEPNIVNLSQVIRQGEAANEDNSEMPVSDMSNNRQGLGEICPNRLNQNQEEELKRERSSVEPMQIRLNNNNLAFSSSSSNPSSSLSSHKSWSSEQRKKN
jgi:hypothetical protein